MLLRLPPESLLPDLLASAALLSVLVIVGWATRRALRARADLPAQALRRWRANIRNALLLVAMVGLLMIWAPQLRTFALSLTAVAVAVVVATKELILCLSGSAFRTITRAYSIGDFVEIGDHRGEVLDINLLASRLREFDARESSLRSRELSSLVPHSLLFTNPVRILARAGANPDHVFSLVFETKLDLFSQLGEIRSAAMATLESELSQTKADRHARVENLSISIRTTELGRQKLEFTFRSRPDHVATIENAIAAAVGTWVMSRQDSKSDGAGLQASGAAHSRME